LRVTRGASLEAGPFDQAKRAIGAGVTISQNNEREKRFDLLRTAGYVAPVNCNRNLMLSDALLLCGAAVGF
jgi:hypothetical protein